MSRARTTTTPTQKRTPRGAVVVRSGAEIQRERDEETARKTADLHWLDEGYAYAKKIGAKGILPPAATTAHPHRKASNPNPLNLTRHQGLPASAARHDPLPAGRVKGEQVRDECMNGAGSEAYSRP
jgi:hypothetical protein